MYTGWQERQLSNDEIQSLYEGTLTLPGFMNNEYLIIGNEDKDYFQWNGEKFIRCKYPQISTEFGGQLKPRNPQQFCAFNLLLNSAIPVKVLKGVYGSGKDYLMLNAALDQINKGIYDHLIYIRPNIIVKDMPDIGALPGTAEEKLSWTLGPFIDKLGGEEGIELLMRDHILQVIPLIFIRGRSFNNSIVYVSEGQNMTTEIIKLLLGRIGENSTLWINGDTHQTDKKIFDSDNGINVLIDKLKGNELFGYVYLPKTERSAVANLANLLD